MYEKLDEAIAAYSATEYLKASEIFADIEDCMPEDDYEQECFSTLLLLLSMHYEDGDYIPKNEAKAVKYLRKAAELGDTTAINLLGVWYSEGKYGIAPDLAKEVELYTTAAKAGNAFACFNLALTYQDEHKELAKQWFLKASELGHEEADKYARELDRFQFKMIHAAMVIFVILALFVGILIQARFEDSFIVSLLRENMLPLIKVLDYFPYAFYAFPALMLSLYMHELGHAFVGYKLGDTINTTNRGKLSLNPFRYWSAVGVLLWAATGFIFARAFMSDKITNDKHKVGMVAAAGSMTSILWGVFCGVILRSTILSGIVLPMPVAVILTESFLLSCFLGVFNLLPIYPLDGSKMLAVFIPDAFRPRLDQFLNSKAGDILTWIFIIGFLILSVTGIIDFSALMYSSIEIFSALVLGGL